MPEPPNPSPTPAPPPDDDPEHVLDEVFLLGEDQEAWLEIARRASRPADPLGNLGPYVLLEEIGRGGQGEVYKAVQPGTGRVVALKRLAVGGFRIGSRAAERFSREVEASTRLSHPNVVTIYAAEVVDAHAVLVMEWIDGTTIDRWADVCWSDPSMNDRDARARVLWAFVEACDGVAHAHQRGVIHRDLKPSNIMIGPDGVPRVLDFGVAKVLEEWREQDPSGDGARATAWTATGFAGTPAYAPPEQLHDSGRAVDTRADVYALGVILYRLLSGEEAFGYRQGLADLLDAVRRGPSHRPSQVRPAVGREADWIVHKAMEADPSRRYQTVDALAEDVRRLLDGRAVLAHPPSAAYAAWRAVRRRPRMLGAAILAAMAITALSLVASVQAIRLGQRTADLAVALDTANEQRERAENEARHRELFNQRLLEATASAVNHETFFLAADPSPVVALESLVSGLVPMDGPETIVNLRMRLGFAYVQARRYADAERELAAAQAVSETIDDPAGERYGWIVLERARCLQLSGRVQDRLELLDAAISRTQQMSPTVYSALFYWSRVFALNNLGRPTDEVIDAAQLAIDKVDVHVDRPSERAKVREEFVPVARGRGREDLADKWSRDALEIATQHRIERGTVSRLQFAYASSLIRRGAWEEAEVLLRATSQYRVERETAAGNRAHRFTVSHARVLHRLERFEEAARAWDIALVRPLAAAKRNERVISQLRVCLAAAKFAVGETDAARVALAMAVSSGTSGAWQNPDFAEQVNRIEQLLRAADWQFDDIDQAELGDLGWILIERWQEPAAIEREEQGD